MITNGSTSNNQINVEPSNLNMLMSYNIQFQKEDYASGTSPDNHRFEARTGLMKTNEFFGVINFLKSILIFISRPNSDVTDLSCSDL